MQYYIIGEREIVLAFNLVGISGAVASTPEEAKTEFQKIIGDSSNSSAVPMTLAERPRVLILTEDVATFLKKEVLAWQMTGKYPLLIEVPCLQGRMEGRTSLSDAIREAIGIQI